MASRLRRATVLLAGGLLVAGLGGLAGCTSSSGSTGSAGSTGSTGSVAASGPNGVEALPADEVLAKSKAAAKAASWVHVTGTQDGTTLDLHVGHDQATGTLSETGVLAKLLAVGGHTYLQGDASFWNDALGTDVGDKLAGHWVLADKVAGDSLASFTDIGRLFDLVMSPEGPLTKQAPTTVDGKPVVGLLEAGDGSVLYVSTQGEPYPVTIRTPTPSASPSSPSTPSVAPPSFDGWNVAVPLAPPSQVLDPAKLGL